MAFLIFILIYIVTIQEQQLIALPKSKETRYGKMRPPIISLPVPHTSANHQRSLAVRREVRDLMRVALKKDLLKENANHGDI